MKRNIIYILLLLGVLLTSCDLDRLPNNSIVDQEFWGSEQDYALACNSFYLELPSFTSRDTYSDICFGTQPNDFSSGSYLPTNSFGPWDDSYENIAKANKVIENAEENEKDVEEAIVKRYMGEAKFFRALQYYDLLRSYGGVPIIDKLLDIDSEELYAPRNTRAEVVDLILTDLDDAIAYLPLPSKLDATEKGRFTKTAALTLKSRVALYEGTRQKFKEKGEYKDLLQQAKDAAYEVIASKEHSLFKSATKDPVLNFQECFIYEGEGSKETILANRYHESWRKHSNSQGLLRQSGNCPTRAIVDAFLCNDGLPIDQSSLFGGYDTPASEYEKRDPRMRASLFVPFEDIAWNGSPYQPQFSNESSNTGYTWKKMTVNADAVALESDLDAIIIRYAEALLNYAEATYELNDKITDADLDISINELRKRVLMPSLTNDFIDNYGLNMRGEIRRERLVELANEGFRYDDLLRWGVAQDVLTKPLVGMPDLKKHYPRLSKNIWKKLKNGFIELQPTTTRVFEDKHYLWPLPLIQIALNENLEQNPGW